jgi:hypothetical protein
MFIKIILLHTDSLSAIFFVCGITLHYVDEEFYLERQKNEEEGY